MKNKVDISFITTIKNGSLLFEETAESVSLQRGVSFEYIVVDDGSSAEEKKKISSILNRLQQESGLNFKYIDNKATGRARALNYAILNSNGRYIANIDADDPSSPDRAKMQLSVIEYSEFDVVFSRSLIILNDEKCHFFDCNASEKVENVKKMGIELLARNPLNHSSLFARRDFFNKFSYDNNKEMMIDYDLYLRAYQAGQRLGIIESKLASKRLHPDQSFERSNHFNYVWNCYKLQLNYLRFDCKYILIYFKILSKLLYGIIKGILR